MNSCTLCERKCSINRIKGEKGYCGLGKDSYLFKDFVHWGEEGDLSPSHTLYFSGCNMRCLYCDNNNYIEKPNSFHLVKTDSLVVRIEACSKSGAKNINFVGGEPTVNLLSIVKILSKIKNKIPVVWNSNMFATPEVMKIIDLFADIYLADFKFGNDKCATEIAKVKNYLNVLTRNLKSISDQKRIIIRHLPLPGHLNCCSKPIIKWLADNMPEVELSLTANLFPTKNYSRGISSVEFEDLLEFQRKCGLKEVSAPVLSKKINHDEEEMILESNIIIKPDGSILFQDLNGNLANIVKDISFKH